MESSLQFVVVVVIVVIIIVIVIVFFFSNVHVRTSTGQSPLRYLNLNVGSYHLVVRPVGCGGKGKRLSENFNIDN